MPKYRIELDLRISAELSEDEMFPDGRPDELPPGQLSASDVLDYVKTQISTYDDLQDWGLMPDDNDITVGIGRDTATSRLRLRT